MRLPVIFRESSKADATEASVMLNEIRMGDSIMTKARKAGRLIEEGWTQVRVARAYGVSHVSVHFWLRLLLLTPVLQAALERGELRSDAAQRLALLKPSEQEAAVDEVTREVMQARHEREARKVERDEGAVLRRRLAEADVETPAGPHTNGVRAAATSAKPAPRRDPMGFYRTGNRIRDLTKFVLQVDPQALPAEFHLLLLWILHDPGTTAEHLTARWPRLGAFFAS